MSSNFIRWTGDGPDGFSLTLVGLLDPDGSMWTGNATSPSSVWRFSMDPGSHVAKQVNPPHYNYDLHMSNMGAVARAGPAMNFEIFTAAFGISSWPGLAPIPPGLSPPYLPRGFGWGFTFETPAGGPQVPPGWSGSYYVTLLRATLPSDFTTWLYVIDVSVACPSIVGAPGNLKVGLEPN